MAVMRRACGAAPLLALAAPLFLLSNSRAPLFCTATGIPPIVRDNAHQQHELLRHNLQPSTTAAAAAAAARAQEEQEEEEEDEEHQVHRALSGRFHTKDGTSKLLEGKPASAVPEQVHIAFAESRSLEEYAMTIEWSTWAEARSQVAWGPSANELISLAEGSATTYSAHYPGRVDYTSGFLHSATLEDLQPSTTYYYSCGDESLAMSAVRSFVTPPKIGAEQAITLGVLGDLGQTDYSAETLAAIDADKSLDFVVHVGDLSYADCDQPRWDSFMRLLEPVASRLPWMVAAGNHEIEAGATGSRPFVAYEKRFRMPATAPPSQGYNCGRGGGLDGLADGSGRGDGACGEGLGADEANAAAVAVATRLEAVGERPAGKAVGAAVRASARAVRETFGMAGGAGGGEGGQADGQDEEEEEGELPMCCPSEWSGTYDYGNSFYSFDVGPAHVTVLNPYTSSGEDSEQYRWLQRDLESTDRTLTPWIIVMAHCPWYNSNLAHQGERQTETAMRAMEPLLYEHKVAVVIAGHVHAYERSYPVVGFELTDDGPTHLVVGGAGNREGHAAEFYSQPEWSAFRNGTVYGSGRLAIRSSSLALWEWKASGESADPHDVALISNPFSPFTPGDMPRADNGVDGVGLSVSDSVPSNHKEDDSGKDRVHGRLRVRRPHARVAL